MYWLRPGRKFFRTRRLDLVRAIDRMLQKAHIALNLIKLDELSVCSRC